jgi:hypothetical protein
VQEMNETHSMKRDLGETLCNMLDRGSRHETIQNSKMPFFSR